MAYHYKPITIKIFEKLLKRNSHLNSKDVKMLLNTNSKNSLLMLKVLEISNQLIRTFEINKGKSRYTCFTIHDNLNTKSIEESNLLNEMLGEFTVLDQSFKQEYKRRLKRHDDKYNDGRFYGRKAKRLGFYSTVVMFDGLRTVIFKNKPDTTCIKFREFKEKYTKEVFNRDGDDMGEDLVERFFNKQLSDYPCEDKKLFLRSDIDLHGAEDQNTDINKTEIHKDLRKEVLKYCIFPAFSVPKDNGYVNSFGEVAIETIKYLSELQHNSFKKMEFSFDKKIFYHLSLYQLFKIIPINARNGRRKLFLYIFSLSRENNKLSKYFYELECKNTGVTSSKRIIKGSSLIEQTKLIYNTAEKVWETIENEKNIDFIFKKISLTEIRSFYKVAQKNHIINSIKAFIDSKIMERNIDILKLSGVMFLVHKNVIGKKKTRNGFFRDEIETVLTITSDLNETLINLTNTTDLKKAVTLSQFINISDLRYLYKNTLPIQERLDFFNKLKLNDIETFMHSYNQAIYTTKEKVVDIQKYWGARLKAIRSHSKLIIPCKKMIKLTRYEHKKLYKLKKRILKYGKLPELSESVFNEKLVNNLKEKRIIYQDGCVNPDFLKMKFDKLKTFTCIPVQKIKANILIENIYYLLLKKGAMCINKVASELEFFTSYDICYAIKGKMLFEVLKTKYGLSISIK
ncbi:hypothetical protein CDIK_0566 [Cucumispora dikerogammari]|nr:hypothetical protein CDIK_0566 [Cucumispora dikerogammari]